MAYGHMSHLVLEPSLIYDPEFHINCVQIRFVINSDQLQLWAHNQYFKYALKLVPTSQSEVPFPVLNYLIITFNYLLVHMGYHATCVEVRGQLVGLVLSFTTWDPGIDGDL